jgi:hypothetical protein
VGRKPSEHRRAAPAGADQVRPWRPRPAVCSSAIAQHTSGVASSSHVRTMSLVLPAVGYRSTRLKNEPPAGAPVNKPQPAAAPAAPAASGCSSWNAACRARTASSTRSSAMITVIRISDVEIISMLIPVSAMTPNILAA